MIGALVPAAIMSIAAANLWTRNIYKAFIKPRRDRTRRRRSRARCASLVVKFGALVFVLALSNDSTPSTCSCSAASGSCRPCRRSWSASTRGGSTDGRCSPAGRSAWSTAPGSPTTTPRSAIQAATSASPLNEFPTTETLVYIGFTALVLNLLVTVVLTLALRAASVDEGTDATSPEDYGADLGDEGVDAELDPEVATH